MTKKQKRDLIMIQEAVRKMVINLVNGKPHKDILAEWDYARGTSWFPNA